MLVWTLSNFEFKKKGKYPHVHSTLEKLGLPTFL